MSALIMFLLPYTALLILVVWELRQRFKKHQPAPLGPTRYADVRGFKPKCAQFDPAGDCPDCGAKWYGPPGHPLEDCPRCGAEVL